MEGLDALLGCGEEEEEALLVGPPPAAAARPLPAAPPRPAAQPGSAPSRGGFQAVGRAAEAQQKLDERASSAAAAAGRTDMTVERFSGLRIKCGGPELLGRELPARSDS